MTLLKASLYVCLIVATACLIVGWTETGKSWMAWAPILPAAALWLSRKPSAAWLAPVSLLAFVGLAAAGVLVGAAPAWMVTSAAAALAAWDLVNLERSTGKSRHPRLEKRHLQILIPALGLGVFLALAGRTITLSLPFIVMLLLIFLGLFSLDRLSRYLSHRL